MTNSNVIHSFFEQSSTIFDFIVLEKFIYADYLLIISIITLSLLLGILKIFNIYKTQIYVIVIIALVGFIVLKQLESKYYETSEENFVIILGKLLGVFLLFYVLLLNQESKTQEIRFEYPTLIMIAFFGVLLTLESSEGLIIFLGLEIQAFTFYTLVSLNEKNIFSAEGALKYFLIGAMASGLFIFGFALLYSTLGTTNLTEISDLLGENSNSMVILGGICVLMGLLFKIGAAPFHLWLPDAYQGAPFYVLILLIVLPKFALFYLLYALNNIFEQNLLVFVALILSAIVGAIQAVEQTKIKRFIAYTIIYNNAFFLGLVLISGKGAFFGLIQSLILYIIISLTTAICFFVLRNAENNNHITNLRDLLALKKSNNGLALVIIFSFFSAAGIPPFIGFFQKYIVLLHLVDRFQWFLVCVLILSSILPAFYYIRMPKIIYFVKDTKFLLLQNISKIGATIIAFGTALSLLIFY